MTLNMTTTTTKPPGDNARQHNPRQRSTYTQANTQGYFKIALHTVKIQSKRNFKTH